jgi:hypothetical protein
MAFTRPYIKTTPDKASWHKVCEDTKQPLSVSNILKTAI